MLIPGDLLKPKDIPTTADGWARFIKEQGGCLLGTEHTEGFQREWVINGQSLAPFFKSGGPLTVLHHNLRMTNTHNPTIGGDFMKLYVKPYVGLSPSDVINNVNYVIIAPLYQNWLREKPAGTYQMSEVVEQTDYPSETAYEIRFRYPGAHTDRGRIGMNVDVILPKSVAIDYAGQIQQGNINLPRKVAELLYTGIQE